MTKGYPNLEGLRFAAAATVVLWHYQQFAYTNTDASSVVRSEQPFAGLLGPVYQFGANAVQVFWLLSGFIFFAQYSQALAAHTISAWQFAVRRFSRLYPLHLVTMLVVFVVQQVYRAVNGDYFVYRLNGAGDVGLHVLFASQWAPHRAYSLNGPVWSVSLEILAYAAFFVAARYLPRSYWLAVAAPPLLAWSLLHQSLLGQCLALFFLGGGAWLISTGLRPHRRVAWIAAAAVALWAAAFGHALQGRMQPHAALSYGGQLLLYSLSAATLVVLGSVRQACGRLANALTWLGDLTYSSYLTHFPLQLIAMTVVTAAGYRLDWRSPWLFLGYVTVVFVVARLTYDRFERPWQERIRDMADRMAQ